MSEIITCIRCRSKFAIKELKTAKCCPSCGCSVMALRSSQDVNIKINWYELKLICSYAEGFVLQSEDIESLKTLHSIIHELKRQFPKYPEISLFEYSNLNDEITNIVDEEIETIEIPNDVTIH